MNDKLDDRPAPERMPTVSTITGTVYNNSRGVPVLKRGTRVSKSRLDALALPPIRSSGDAE